MMQMVFTFIGVAAVSYWLAFPVMDKLEGWK